MNIAVRFTLKFSAFNLYQSCLDKIVGYNKRCPVKFEFDINSAFFLVYVPLGNVVRLKLPSLVKSVLA